MRIGILTVPLYTNYGGILQAYALQTVLERMGHKVSVFDTNKHRRLPIWKIPLSFGKRVLKNMLGKRCDIFLEKRYNREFPIITQHIRPFVTKHIHRSVVNDFRKLKEKDFDAVVVGSDQIWRPKYYRKIQTAYLDFAKTWDIKRVAYAVSFGVDNWEYTPELTSCCKRLVAAFDAVSVRESSGVRLCKEYFDLDAVHVLDPTMLLDKEDYMLIANEADTQPSKGDFACYILDKTEKKRCLVSRLSLENGLTPFNINSRVGDKSAPLEKRIQMSVEQWLRSFQDAKYVVTDSFHACVFSILFNKPFVVVANDDRGLARIKSLLAMFGLEQCLYSPQWAWSVMNSIDWENINARMGVWRKVSHNFLHDTLL